MPVAPAATGSPALTHLACPRAVAWALLCSRGGGSLGLLWACLLVGWLGFGVYARGVFVWVFACLLVCARLGVVGQCGCVRPFASACLLACSRSGVGLLACAMLPWVRGNGKWGGTTLSRPIQRGVRCPAAAWRAREGLWVLSWCANTRAYAERRGRGEPRGADSGGLAGGGGAGIPCWRAVSTRGRAKLTLLGRGR